MRKLPAGWTQDGRVFFWESEELTPAMVMWRDMGFAGWVMAPVSVPDFDTQAATKARNWFLDEWLTLPNHNKRYYRMNGTTWDCFQDV